MLREIYERHDKDKESWKRIPALLLKYAGQELEVLAVALVKHVGEMNTRAQVVAYGELTLWLRQRFPLPRVEAASNTVEISDGSADEIEDATMKLSPRSLFLRNVIEVLEGLRHHRMVAAG